MATLRPHHLFLLLLHHVLTVCSTVAAFAPEDNFLINCGANATVTSADGRPFRPDTSGEVSSFVMSPISHDVVQISSSDVYGSARVFREAAAYRFSIRQKGRHLLRLHFRPVRSSLYDMKSASFSVKANEYTLLHNFSCSRLDLCRSAVVKEYIFEVGLVVNQLSVLSWWLLRMAPSNSSMPSKLYQCPVIWFLLLHPRFLQGLVSRFRLVQASRLHIGSMWVVQFWIRATTPCEEFGRMIGRSWSFQLRCTASQLIRIQSDIHLKYRKYIAPSLVYATAQEMADANVGNQKFNISWVFKIELGFMYLVRLHFCDFFEQVHQKPSVQCLYFVDFIIYVQMDSDRRILVQIGPPELTNFPPDAILNGLEIFKLSDSDDNFDVNHIIWCILLMLSGRRNAKKPTLASFPSPVAPTTHTGSPNTKLSARSYASSGPSLGIGQLLAFSEIQEVTKNFDESLVVGIGGFGKVYKGVLENGLVVAVKRGNPQSQQGLVEFRTEIEMLSKLRHRHLVSLIGHCHEANNYGACL
ncbi:hypothetical protein OPV22_029297 [Ensete ventricosum]|uniref:Protein kinase domain-containing protein n=1 Tax=Ensete ventricosum TaxID=4639 RepID=A0AAV8QCV6_ENSVE|nr:hypothetical protein OPV22_029297 [Ensete ventricosum]